MYMLFEHLLFISLNLYCKKVHKKYHEYVIIYITFTIWHHFLQGTIRSLHFAQDWNETCYSDLNLVH